MSVTAESLHRSNKRRRQRAAAHQVVRPTNLAELKSILEPGAPLKAPFRPRGAGSAATDCNSSVGTVIDMSALDNIVDIDAYNHRITVQAGARIGQVAEALAVHGMELRGQS